MTPEEPVDYPFQEVLSSLKSREDKPDSRGTLVVVLVVVVIAVLSVGILMFRSFRTGKKLAKARHERDKLQEQLRQVETDKILEASDKTVQDIQEQLTTLEQEVQDLALRRESLTRALQDATTWEALDQITR